MDRFVVYEVLADGEHSYRSTHYTREQAQAWIDGELKDVGVCEYTIRVYVDNARQRKQRQINNRAMC